MRDGKPEKSGTESMDIAIRMTRLLYPEIPETEIHRIAKIVADVSSPRRPEDKEARSNV